MNAVLTVTIGEILTPLIGIGFGGFVIWGVFHLAEKYLGIRYVSKWDRNVVSKNLESHRINQMALDQKGKVRPDLVKKAYEELERKKYAKTSSNLIAEINKLERKEDILNTKWMSDISNELTRQIHPEFFEKPSKEKLLEMLTQIKESGTMTDEEFEELKRKIL